MDGEATDFVIENGELVPVEMIETLEENEINLTVTVKNPEELVLMLHAIRDLRGWLRLQ